MCLFWVPLGLLEKFVTILLLQTFLSFSPTYIWHYHSSISKFHFILNVEWILLYYKLKRIQSKNHSLNDLWSTCNFRHFPIIIMDSFFGSYFVSLTWVSSSQSAWHLTTLEAFDTTWRSSGMLAFSLWKKFRKLVCPLERAAVKLQFLELGKLSMNLKVVHTLRKVRII